MRNSYRGFTLIELIVVIVILGILSAVALPKFVDFGSDARKSVLNSIQGAAASAATMAYAKAATSGTIDLTLAAAGPLTINGQSISFVYGYPTAATINLLMQDAGGATFNAGVWTLKTNCTVTYAVPASSGANPTFTQTTSGC